MLSKIAALGWVLSAAIHFALRLRLASPTWWMSPLLGIGLAIVWLPAIARGFNPSGGGAGRRVWLIVAFCCGYAALNLRWLPEPIEERWPVALSGQLIAFYAVATALLWPSPARAPRSSQVSGFQRSR